MGQLCKLSEGQKNGIVKLHLGFPSIVLFSLSSRHRIVSPTESAGHCSRKELAGDSCQHPDDNRRGLPHALPGAGEEEGKAGGGGL